MNSSNWTGIENVPVPESELPDPSACPVVWSVIVTTCPPGEVTP
jgi:hypothetical protein